ncbi:MAG: aldehyde dehydrogenase (NADP(+)) [Flavobacteriaceae bacterium]|nr:aldehyde dehydrogenase (NADP(+)) [Flavobacteriaceae bacterium]
MELTGGNYIAGKNSSNGKSIFKAINPSDTLELPTTFHEATKQEVDEAVNSAFEAFSVYGKKSGNEKAVLLDTIADEILNLGEELIERCSAETGLPAARITGERGRTMGQLKLFANVLREGSWVDARIDTAIPDRQPIPKPDVRSMLKALGPVGIFGASNFPLAFSVAGGDTASALASGCPVVVKAHPSHPGTCELIAIAINNAIKKTNMPNGVFSLLQGTSVEVGMAIVNHPSIKAIGFTGSYKGGKAIFDAANNRDEPIPVYSEMGSTNPVFILPGIISEKSDEIAEGITNSVTLGVGQFCTNPGLVFFEKNTNSNSFSEKVSNYFEKVEANPMLNKSIKESFDRGVNELTKTPDVTMVAKGNDNGEGYKGRAYVFETSAKNFLSNNTLEEEVFGPSTISVIADSKSDLLASAKKLKGHLTATVFANAGDLASYSELIEILEQKVGRLIINNFPTGVEVCPSMVHGGPFPATTDSRSTSVGTRAITRFARPFCYQNFPQSLLPDELKDENILGITRILNGEYTK